MNRKTTKPVKKSPSISREPARKPVHAVRESMEEIEIRAQTTTEVLRRFLTFPLRPVAS